jgi:ubiquitin-protein ligase
MATPRDRRLQADYEKVVRLIAESGGTLRLVRSVGVPPVSYIIEYNCPSLAKDPMGAITVRRKHEVEINLSMTYPFKAPTARMLTPVFNPHVWMDHIPDVICLGGVWSAAETIDTLILRIGALLQLDPRVLDAKSPANVEANLWVQQNRSRIPLGTVSFKMATKPPSRVQWS